MNIKKNIKKTAQYLFIAFIGILLLYRTYQDIPLNELCHILGEVKVGWILLAVIAHLINHFLRAFRWRLFVGVQGHHLSVVSFFLAEMNGFFINLIMPRMGDWVRCVSLKRLEKVAVSKSLGGVLVERIIDIFIFLCLFNIAFLLDFFKGLNILPNLSNQIGTVFSFDISNSVLFFTSIVLLVTGVIIYKWNRHFILIIWNQFNLFFKEVWDAIAEIRKCNGVVLSIVSLFIWVFQFLVEYLSFFSIENIDISLEGILFVFIAMNLGMSTPIPGGVGLYHLGVISTLVALGVDPKYALVYATITHSIQVFNAIVVGGVCSLYVTFFKQKESL